MRARFHTNLDDAKSYVSKLNISDDYINCNPMVGDIMEFELPKREGEIQKRFSLEVIARKWDTDGELQVELHLGSGTYCRSVGDFEEMMRRFKY